MVAMYYMRMHVQQIMCLLAMDLCASQIYRPLSTAQIRLQSSRGC